MFTFLLETTKKTGKIYEVMAFIMLDVIEKGQRSLKDEKQMR